MQYRPLGRTGLRVSQLGFGCGAVGGLLVRGERAEQRRVVARAIELGVTYFDTARSYGDGLSETNLGAVLKELGTDVLVGTKVDLRGAEMERIEEAVAASLEASLRRLQRERVDLIQLHNPVGRERDAERNWVTAEDVVRIGAAFERLIAQGKASHWGMNGLGETEAVHRAMHASGAETIQSCYNLLNPSAGMRAPLDWPFQDYAGLIDRASETGVGVIGIRVLAGGALSGSASRHPLAAQSVSPIATGSSLAADADAAQRFSFLVAEGYADSLVEAAIRFALSKPELSTALVGISSLEQLETAVASANRGPLPDEALTRLPEAWAALRG